MADFDTRDIGRMLAQRYGEGEDKPWNPPPDRGENPGSIESYEPNLLDKIRSYGGERGLGASMVLPPIMAYAGGQNLGSGYLFGDPGRAALGAGQLGLAAFPTVAAGRSAVADLTAARAAKTADIASRGPWGNPKMLDEMLNRQAETRAPRHELNEPLPAKDPSETDPWSPVRWERLHAQRDALHDEAKNFLLPERGDFVLGDVDYRPNGDAFGTWERTKPEGRFSYEVARTRRGSQVANTAGEGGWPPISKEEGLARDVEQHGWNNENVPGMVDKAQDLAGRLRSINAEQAPYHVRHNDEFSAFWRKGDSGAGDARSIRARYLEDAEKFGQDRLNRTAGLYEPHAVTFEEPEELRHVLVDEFGANPRDAASLEDAYNRFWQDEYARRAAGKPTRHYEEALRQRWEEDNFFRGIGVDPTKHSPEELDDFMREHIAGIRARIADLKGEVHRKMGISSGATQPPSQGGLGATAANGLMRYGPPAAVLGYGGYKFGKLAADKIVAMNDTSEDEGKAFADRPRIHASYPQGGMSGNAAHLNNIGTGIGSTIPETIANQRDDAKTDERSGKVRLGIHSIFGPAGMFPFETKKGKAAWLASQGFLAHDAYQDINKAQDRQRFWDMMEREYGNKLPQLDRDTVLD